jgi:hypothetical protein
MKNYQKYVNALAIVAALGWVGFCVHMGWY